MPYLQLDVNDHYTRDQKHALAKKLCQTYTAMMTVDIRRISVAIREVGDGGVWRTVNDSGDLEPVSVLMCDIRKGRPPEQRMALAKRLIADCVEILGLREDRLNVEFTQHTGDEMYHPTLGGFSPDWSPDE